MEYKCQACGFRVFNRRYPKCESCGTELAAGIALSSLERETLFGQDRVASELEWRDKQRKAMNTPSDSDAGLGLISISIATGGGGE